MEIVQICSDEYSLNCDMHWGEERCIKCQSGYEINGKNCSLCSNSCLNCSFYNGKEKCLKCKYGYMNSLGECFKDLRDKYCISYRFKNTFHPRVYWRYNEKF